MTTDMLALAVGVMIAASYWWTRRLWRLTQSQREALERDCLDSTIKWAYIRGAHDLMMRGHVDDESAEFTVIHFRTQWGDDLRETRS